MGDGIADLEVEFLGFLQAQRNRCRYLKHLASYTRLVMVILHQALMGADLGVNCRDHYAYGGSLDNVSGIRTQVPLMDHRECIETKSSHNHQVPHVRAVMCPVLRTQTASSIYDDEIRCSFQGCFA